MELGRDKEIKFLRADFFCRVVEIRVKTHAFFAPTNLWMFSARWSQTIAL